MDSVQQASIVLESSRWLREVGAALEIHPGIVHSLPRLVDRGEDRRPAFMMACGPDLLVQATVAAVGAAELEVGLPVPDDPAEESLAELVAALGLEGSQGGLAAGALPGLAVLALGRATLLGGRAILDSVPAGLGARLRGVREVIAELAPREVGEVARTVAAVLRVRLEASYEVASEQVGSRPALHLASELMTDGLLLCLPAEPGPEHAEMVLGALGSPVSVQEARAVLADPSAPAEESESEALRRALLRWDLTNSVLSHLVFLTRGADTWQLPDGPLPDHAPGQLVLPRGEVRIDSVVVALRLDALQEATAAAASPSVARAVVDHAWQVLTEDQPTGLHARCGGFGISLFQSPLEALEFAERSTRTLSGPRNLPFGIQGRSIAVGPGARVAAGVALGPIWGGTDGERVELDGPTVARAVALSCEEGWSSRVLSDLAGQVHRDTRSGIRCDESVWRAALREATQAGRPVVEIGSSTAPTLRRLPIRGWWESKGRRQVLVGLPQIRAGGAAELVTLEANQLRALLEADGGAATPAEDGRSDTAGAGRGSWDRVQVRPRVSTADPLRAASLMGVDLSVEGEDDARTVATELHRKALSGVAASPDDVTDDIVPSALAGSLSDLDIPAWDATGFSLPEYSQEFSDAVEPAVGPPERAGGYSLEVDDDYGFEDLDDRPTVADSESGEVDPTAHAEPGLSSETPLLEPVAEPAEDPVEGQGPSGPDFDVFALTDEDAQALSADSGTYLLSGDAFLSSGSSDSGDLAAPPDAFLAVEEAEVAIEDADEEWEDEEYAVGSADDWETTPGAASAPGEDLLDLDELFEHSQSPPDELTPPTPADLPPPSSADSPQAQPAAGDVGPPAGAARRKAGEVTAADIANLFDGYVVVRDMTGCYTFGLRDGSQLRDAHSYETGGDSDAAYRAFVQAKVAEGFVPRLDLWSPMPAGGDPSALDPTLLQRAYAAMLTS